MDRMILPLFGAMFLWLLGAASIWVYDYHPTIGWHVTVPLVGWHLGFDLPNSLETRLEQTSSQLAQAEAQLKPWQDSYLQEKRQLDAVNGGQQAVIAAGLAKLNQAQDIAKAQLVVQNVAAAKRSNVMAALPIVAGDSNVCSRVEAVDAAFIRELNH